MQTETYRGLVVWQKAMDVVGDIYLLTERLPSSEKYGLLSQMRRAAVSIPSNIAEGYRRGHRKEYVQFLSVSYGSGAELETQIEICRRLMLMPAETLMVLQDRLDHVMRMLNVMIRKLQ